MIRINLLKNAIQKKALKVQMPSTARLKLISIIVAVVLIVGGGTGYLFVLKKPAKSVKPPSALVATGFKPSTHASSNIIEDVVREVNDAQQISHPGLLQISYEDMSPSERIIYEVLFGKTTFEMLSRVIPDGIGLKTLEIDNFQTVYAVGLGESREIITSTFSALKNERLELLSQPYSYIAPNAGKGYRFVVTCKTGFGLDLADPFQAIDHLVSRQELSGLLKKIKVMAIDSEVGFNNEPEQVSAEKAGTYRRFIYRFSGECTYKNFVSFVFRLHKEQVPCAFKKVNIKALSGLNIGVDIEVLLTLKE
jgi:hypothetical protein